MHAQRGGSDAAVHDCSLTSCHLAVAGKGAVLIGAGDAGFLRVICRPVKDAQMNKLYSYVAASIQQIEE